MITILLTFVIWLLLNTIAQHDLKGTIYLTTEVTPVTVRKVRRRYTQQHIESINLLELLP